MKEKFLNFLESIKSSELFIDLKERYEQQDQEKKLLINLAVLGGILFICIAPALWGIGNLNRIKSRIDAREESLGMLSKASEQIRLYKSTQNSQKAASAGNSLTTLLDNVLNNGRIDRAKIQIEAEQIGQEDKESQEVLIKVKLSQINLRHLQEFLFKVTDYGSTKHVNIKDLLIDTKDDPSGYLDAETTLSMYKAK